MTNNTEKLQYDQKTLSQKHNECFWVMIMWCWQIPRHDKYLWWHTVCDVYSLSQFWRQFSTILALHTTLSIALSIKCQKILTLSSLLLWIVLKPPCKMWYNLSVVMSIDVTCHLYNSITHIPDKPWLLFYKYQAFTGNLNPTSVKIPSKIQDTLLEFLSFLSS